ncbi:TonB-dependent receptor [Hymenobacter sp. IS2118]|uniref:TonB-dependent receptor n=1 Tax=Hymenobacter sp. IS2118 TaxID=1505605 RepID=UPI0005537938|nr:TonB-dependent receptor [Hymenobacter sp. IS2118]
MRQPYFVFILCLLLPLGSWAQGAQAISGTVQTEVGTSLPGATVVVKGTYTGGSTNEEGQFQLKADFSKGPLVLSVSFIGYETQELPLSAPDNAIIVTLRPSAVLDQVVVAASRVEESIGQVPVTVEKLNQRQVEQITTPDLVAGLGRFKGIDISSSSMLSTSFSTRGFNSSRSERVIQLADYMDTSIPSLTSNFGNLLGTPILDVASVEIVHGPASALYGANAFNGVLLTNSKDPFIDQGLTVRLRGGTRSLLDGQLRYAQKIGERVAFKIVGGAIRADDFIADNQSATSSLIEPNNNAVGSPAGYDAVSRYGDVGAITLGTTLINPATRTPYLDRNGSPIATPAALVGKTLFLPGFTEAQLIGSDDKTHSYKVAPSLAVLLTNSIKATVDYKYTNATTTYQSASRYRFINSGAHQGRVQLEGSNWFIRAFTTRDYSGGRDPQTDGSYNLGFLGGFLQNQVIPSSSTTYAQRYVGTYLGTLAGSLSGGLPADAAINAAVAAARPTLLQPGTPEFAAARNQIIHDPTPGQGARLVLRSILNDGSGQYTYRNSFADLTVGAAYRQFLLGSDGSLFEDTRDGDRIPNYEYGAYAQASKTLLDDHLKLAAAGRVDRFKNFGTAFSPRASAVYSVGADKQHNFRASYSRAFRAPTQNDQYIKLDVGRAILLGNVRSGFEGYSVNVLRGASPADAANLYRADKLTLEEVNSFEIGYRAQLAKKLYVDVDLFRNNFNNFIATQNFVGNVDGTRPAPAQLATTNTAGSSVRVIQVAANVDQEVKSQGAAFTLSYSFSPALILNGNYSYNELTTDNFKAGTQSFFNTPTHKFNLGADGLLLERKLSYNLNYRWVDAFVYESTFATGTVPVAQTLDAQVGYTLPSLHTTLQVGGTNLLDAQNLQVYGAPSIGRIAYFGLLFDIK